MRLFFLFVPFFLFTCVSAGFGADEIVLDRGDVVSGTLVGLEGKWVRFKTDYAKPLEIKKGRIRSIFTDGEVTLEMKTGEIIKGRLRTTDDDRIWIERSPGASPVFVTWERIEAINPPPVKWTGSLALGATRESGNTDRLSSSLSFNAKRRSDKERFTFHVLNNYAEEDDEVTTRNTYGRLKYDYFFTKKFYGFLSIEALYDKFRDINLRTVAGPGAGYQIWDDSRKSLSAELGVAYHNEDKIAGEDDYWFTGRAAADFAYKFSETIEFTEQIIYYPRLEDQSDYQLRNEASVATTLLSSWALKVSHVLEYDSRPEAAIKNRDETWILGLQYSF
ncbi:MAG: DUF481 domain-containing protein [Desulfuromonadales bacterium]|nr:DUF481 domain-containing protein [Desulfuromonadales bacterium]NIS43216.1 DUF481 domain-containing protein [Desulfuromonadales bacterium]